MMKQRDSLKHVTRIVLKVGSSLLADAKHGVNTSMVQRLASDIKALHDKDIQVCLVSSGAVALGRVQLGWLDKKLNVHEKQAAAAIGQPLLMHAYQKAFSELGLVVAQMLLTKDDLRHRRRYINASNTSKTLFAAQVIPIVNENDTVVTEEIRFGDNDTLGALVANLVEADALMILTDQLGMYDADPRKNALAKVIDERFASDPELEAMAGGGGGGLGRGGMATKVKAAQLASRSGANTVIVGGRIENAILIE